MKNLNLELSFNIGDHAFYPFPSDLKVVEGSVIKIFYGSSSDSLNIQYTLSENGTGKTYVASDSDMFSDSHLAKASLKKSLLDDVSRIEAGILKYRHILNILEAKKNDINQTSSQEEYEFIVFGENKEKFFKEEESVYFIDSPRDFRIDDDYFPIHFGKIESAYLSLKNDNNERLISGSYYNVHVDSYYYDGRPKPDEMFYSEHEAFDEAVKNYSNNLSALEKKLDYIKSLIEN